MFDPFQLAQMMAALQANPAMFAEGMATTGMMPPPIDPGMFQPNMDPMMGGGAAFLPGAQPPPMGAPALMQPPMPMMGPSPFGGPPTLGASLGGNPSPGGAPMGGAQDPLAALKAAGRGAPTGSADTKPIMSGGISGAGRAPDPKATKGASSEMQLLQLLMQGSGAGAIPGLGQLLAQGIR